MIKLIIALISVLGLNLIACGDTYYTQSPGEKGEQGEQGEIGAQGPEGEKGDRGDPGKSGIDGVDGTDGAMGPQGDPGEDGEDGESCTVVDNGNGTANLVCSDGTTWPLGAEQVEEDLCESYTDYPRRGEYISSLIELAWSDDLQVGTVPGHANAYLRMGVGIEGSCGHGVVINHVIVQGTSVSSGSSEVEADTVSLYLGDADPGAAFFPRACDETPIEGTIFATCEMDGYALPPHGETEILVGMRLPDMTEAQAAEVKMSVSVNVTDVHSGNTYQLTWWFAPLPQ